MKERLEAIAEMKILTMNLRSISISMRHDARQSCILIRLPVMQHVQIVLTATYLPQVPDAVVSRVTVEVVNLHRGEMSVVPDPDGCVVINKSCHAKMRKAKRNIFIFFVSSHALHSPARFPVHELPFLVIVTIVPLDARRQFRQLALR